MAISSNNLNLMEELGQIRNSLVLSEQMLGKGLDQPFNCSNSGPRKLLYSTQKDHIIPVTYAETPFVTTGYENRYGDLSSSIILAEDDAEVVAIVSKYSFAPRQRYYVIVRGKNNVYNVYERRSYEHTTEMHGYVYNNQYMDSLNPGSKIKRGDRVRSSMSYDQYGNRQDGVNLVCAYLGTDKNMEDSVIVSETAAKKMSTTLIKIVTIILNDNDIPLNLYGHDDVYKFIPSIGEKIKDGILCGIRRENKEDALFTQSFEKLKGIMMSDDKFTLEGTVVDINIKSNNPELLDNYCNSQLKEFYDENIRFSSEIVGVMDSVLANDPGAQMSYDLNKLYTNCKRAMNGEQYIKDGKVYGNTILEITVLKEEALNEGDKLADRYGGKGVVSFVFPDWMMPRTAHGEVVDAIINQSTCVNRENPGQLFETSLIHIGDSICKFINSNLLDPFEAMDLLIQFTSIVSPEESIALAEMKQRYSSEQLEFFVQSVVGDGMLYLSTRPITDNMTLDKLDMLYEMFPWIEQDTLIVPVEDSMGNIRYVEARRKLIVDKKYMHRLKQLADDKFSSTSLSATNIKNQNTKSKQSKAYKSIHSNTPIAQGTMETDDLSHLGMDFVISNLMIHSVSPQARRLCEQMITGDPFKIDIKLTNDCTNRSVEIFNTYMKTKGLRLVFEKFMKNCQPLVTFDLATFPEKNDECRNLVHFVNEDEAFDYDKFNKEMIELEALRKSNLFTMPLAWWDKKKYLKPELDKKTKKQCLEPELLFKPVSKDIVRV